MAAAAAAAAAATAAAPEVAAGPVQQLTMGWAETSLTVFEFALGVVRFLSVSQFGTSWELGGRFDLGALSDSRGRGCL